MFKMLGPAAKAAAHSSNSSVIHLRQPKRHGAPLAAATGANLICTAAVRLLSPKFKCQPECRHRSKQTESACTSEIAH